jgi:hypothetical protein
MPDQARFIFSAWSKHPSGKRVIPTIVLDRVDVMADIVLLPPLHPREKLKGLAEMRK